MITIANVAINGSKITESIKSGHVTYNIYYWQDGDEFTSGHWSYSGPGSTGAKITGTVTATSTMKVNGVSVAVVGDVTNETWIADPPIPSDDGYNKYVATSPTSGSGQGSITGGNSKNVKLNGSLIAIVGSEVTTCLGNTTTIEDGSSLFNM
ncbi:hypothetical protein [Paenibacillus sophorae]|uniref:PAAR motif-containing protein n=1 Tax=Paenibacillus sophorae TaxID=1333845 RepID=A0ABX8H8B4_9BACL|nr:hypothetical protein [Paenibacillus sophorae]QWU14456.1 hypothetical protein KP014_21345 [Paenibacillus sophorae]